MGRHAGLAKPAGLLIAVVVFLVLGQWLIDSLRDAEADERERASIERMITTVRAAQDGAQVDLATALDLPWDRAFLMEAYMSGDEMNRRLEFAWYDRDAISASDESRQFVVFINGHTVVADTVLDDDEFQFDEPVESFARSRGQFIVVREDTSGYVMLSLP